MKPNRYRAPEHLSPALERFYEEFPPPKPVGFVIMRFGSTPEHKAVLKALEDVSRAVDVTLIRADHHQYHDDLLENIRVYLHGCSFGIAIFEDADNKGFNPNVSLEVGYLLALGKHVLPLKSSSLSRMPSDLLSKLYISYTPASIDSKTKKEISDWISQRVFVRRADDSLQTSIQTVSNLLLELFPGIPTADGEVHIARHVEGLRRHDYLTIGSVRKLLEETGDARDWVNHNQLPEFATCAVSYALAIRHPMYADQTFWKGTTANRLKEASKLFLG
jgi:nucleoside 2-deoxyribosyltransferase